MISATAATASDGRTKIVHPHHAQRGARRLRRHDGISRGYMCAHARAPVYLCTRILKDMPSCRRYSRGYLGELKRESDPALPSLAVAAVAGVPRG